MKSSAAMTRAHWVMAGWSTAAESSAAATGAQWAAAELSVAAGWSTAEYRSGNFKKSERERERERNFDSSWVSQFRARHQGARLVHLTKTSILLVIKP